MPCPCRSPRCHTAAGAGRGHRRPGPRAGPPPLVPDRSTPMLSSIYMFFISPSIHSCWEHRCTWDGAAADALGCHSQPKSGIRRPGPAQGKRTLELPLPFLGFPLPVLVCRHYRTAPTVKHRPPPQRPTARSTEAPPPWTGPSSAATSRPGGVTPPWHPPARPAAPPPRCQTWSASGKGTRVLDIHRLCLRFYCLSLSFRFLYFSFHCLSLPFITAFP